MDDESKQMYVDSLNVQVSNHQFLKDCLPVIKHAGSSGNGFPYAPEDFPSLGDVWTWSVGKRCTHAGFWQDRSVHPPDRLQSSMGGIMSFRGRASLEKYIQKTFPDADVDAFFDSFVWKIPCTNVAKDASLKAIKRKGCSKSTTAIIRPGNCKASNEMCHIKAETGSSLTLAACNICCSEPNFCRYCCCILCSKTIDRIYDGYSFIRCEALVDENFICGHVAHVECALRAYLAGKVGGSIDLDAQYYCRCCDNKTDLLLHVEKIIKVSESIDNRDATVKVLNLGFCMLRGSEKERAGKLRNHITTSIEKLKHGVPSEDTWKKRSAISELEQATMVKKGCTFDSLRNIGRQSSSYRSGPHRQGSGRDYHDSSYRFSRDRDYQERGERDRFHEKHKSRSRSPPKNYEKQTDHRDQTSGSSRVLPPTPASTQSMISSHPQRSSVCHRPIDPAALQRLGKESVEADLVAEEHSADSAARMAELKEEFPNICFDGFDVPPNLKKVPDDIMKMTIDNIIDVYNQYREWSKYAEEISEVSFKQMAEIEKLKREDSESKCIITTLTNEIESYRAAQTEAERKAKTATKSMEEMWASHMDMVQVLHHRNQEITLERDTVRSKESAALKEIEDLKAKLEYALKEKDEAQKIAQDACDELINVRTERDTAAKKIKEVDALIQREVEAAKDKAREETTNELEELIVTYNANVLKYRNLTWLGENYPYQLWRAWEFLVAEEKRDLQADEIDLFRLEDEVLLDDEPKTLHEAMLIFQKESAAASQHEVGESSEPSHLDVTADMPPASQNTPSKTFQPPRDMT